MSERKFDYEYRFVSVGGLERKYIGPRSSIVFQSVMLNGGPPPKEWHQVEGSDFLFMTWEELEHVAHVMRDASMPIPSSLPERVQAL